MIPNYILDRIQKEEEGELCKVWGGLQATVFLSEILVELRKLNKNLEENKDAKEKENYKGKGKK